jgi:uncharacterized protein YcbX
VTKRNIGVVKELWRYPVKSMLGEQVEHFVVGERGVAGDRAWALRNAESRHVMSAKKWPRLFGFRARYASDAAVGQEAIIRLPDRAEILTSDPAASAKLSAALGVELSLEAASAGKRARAEIDPATVFGDVPVEKVIPGFTAETLPDTFGLAGGSFFDSAPLHVLATGTLRHLHKIQGGTAKVDARRFRANILVETGPELERFVEDKWIDGILGVGELRVIDMKAALRCVMTTHPQDDLPRDLSILRTAAQHHEATLGVFASVKTAGIVRVGDPVFLLG